MMKIAAILVVSSLAACGGWSKRDTLLELGFAATTADDWHQTRTITYYCDEVNPIIGKCGQGVDVDYYMPAMMLVHAAVSVVLPPRYRTVWQGITLGTEIETVYSNHQAKWWEPPIVVRGGMEVPYTHPLSH